MTITAEPSRVSLTEEQPRTVSARPGLACAGLLLLGAGLMLQHIPDAEDSDARILDYMHASNVLTASVIGYFVWTIALCCFIGFAVQVRDVLRSAGSRESRLIDVGHAAALIFTVMFLVGGAALIAVAGAVQMGGSAPPDPDFVRVLPQFGFGLLRVGGGITNAVFMVTTSLVVKRTGVLPRWTVRAGYICAGVAMVIITPVPLIAIPVWVALMSVAMSRHARLA